MRTALLLVGALIAPLLAPAQTQKPAASSAGISPVRKDFLDTFSGAASRSLALAKAVPKDKLSWRPMEGVRSFNEVFVHMAGSTLLFCSYLGMKMPEGPAHDLATVYMKRGFEMPEIFAAESAIKDPVKIAEVMQQSFDAARDMIRNMSDADLDKTVDFFGTPYTQRRLLIVLSEHLGEHLGQAIAYSRVNHIVPPWSVPKK